MAQTTNKKKVEDTGSVNYSQRQQSPNYATSNNKTLADYGSYERKEYGGSEAANQWLDKYNSMQKPGAFQNQWQQGLNDAINKIMNREKFSYDLNGDALYQQYKDQAVLGGQMAMQDTMGQAAAMTGGYGNSYAQGVGQQAYQGYLQQLNDKVPELYQLALDQYNREGEELYNQYGLLADRENTDYGRHRDAVGDYYTESGLYLDQYNTAEDRDYNRYLEGEKMDYSIFSDKQKLDYQLDRDAIGDSQWQQTYDEGVRQFDESMAFDKEQFAFTKESWQKDFDQSVYQFEQEYKQKEKQIEEDIRHNKITEEQGQQQINLAREELAESKRQAEAELSYKNAALEASKNAKEKEDPYEMSASEYAAWADRMSGLTSEKEAAALRNNMISAGVPEDIAFELYSTYWDKDDKKEENPSGFKTAASNLFGNSKYYSPHSAFIRGVTR